MAQPRWLIKNHSEVKKRFVQGRSFDVLPIINTKQGKVLTLSSLICRFPVLAKREVTGFLGFLRLLRNWLPRLSNSCKLATPIFSWIVIVLKFRLRLDLKIFITYTQRKILPFLPVTNTWLSSVTWSRFVLRFLLFFCFHYFPLFIVMESVEKVKTLDSYWFKLSRV